METYLPAKHLSLIFGKINLKIKTLGKAIGLMFNFEWSNKTLFYGLYERTNLLDNSDLTTVGLPKGEELKS